MILLLLSGRWGCDKIKLFVLTENLGKPSMVRNYAIQHARGDYIAFLDSDDMWEANKLETQIKFMISNNLVLSYTGLKYIDANDLVIENVLLPNESGFLFAQQLKHYSIASMTVMIDLECLSENELLFDEELTIGEDYELFMRLAIKHEIGSLSDSLSLRRVHMESISNKMATLSADDLSRVYDKLKSYDIRNEYNKYFVFLEMKIAYYRAKSLILRGNVEKAKKAINKFKFLDQKMFVLWLSLFFGKKGWEFVHHFKKRS